MNSASSFKAPSVNNIHLLLQIQIALIGIILVAGLFFLWKALTRVDEKIDLFALQFKKFLATPPPPPPHPQHPQHLQQTLRSQQQFLNPFMQVFDQMMNGENIKIHSEDLEEEDDDEESEEESEAESDAEAAEADEADEADDDEDAEESEVVQTITNEEESEENKKLSNPLSKGKLHAMRLEDLKVLCSDRHLSTEGHKPDLINRLLGISRD